MKYLNKQFHKGFTLAELMVCLALISIIATLMMPSISKLKPNKNKIMFKKAYSIAERTVSELIDDAELYPTGDEWQGFDNTSEVEGVLPEGAVGGEKYSGGSKFCGLFASKLDIADGNFVCAQAPRSSKVTSLDGEPTFYSSDGVAWVLPYTDFKPTSTYQVIYVDVNGKQNSPNCYDSDYTRDEINVQRKMSKSYTNPLFGVAMGEDKSSSNTEYCADPDRFKIYVRADGKMKVVGDAAKKYLGTTNLTGNK